MKIFSIIVTYNGMQWYDRCFSSLQKSDVPVNIIVIDNASSDGTVDYIKRKYPDIILIESKENLGFAKANNTGIKYALDHQADFVFYLIRTHGSTRPILSLLLFNNLKLIRNMQFCALYNYMGVVKRLIMGY